MKLNTTDKGIQFYDLTPESSGIKTIIVYLCGGGSPSENPLNSVFVKEFAEVNKDKFRCFAGVLPSGRTGWGFPVDELRTKAGTHLLRYIHENYKSDGNFFQMGWSAGSDIGLVSDCADFITGFVVCAGGGDYQTIKTLGLKAIPARWYHAVDDYAISISKAREYSKVYGPAMQLIEIAKGGHSAAPNTAYDVNSDLASWVISKSKPVEPPEEPVFINDPGKAWYYSESEKLIIFETVNGKKLKVTPD